MNRRNFFQVATATAAVALQDDAIQRVSAAAAAAEEDQPAPPRRRWFHRISGRPLRLGLSDTRS